ncbi:MAG TPA: fibronectin type III domain-containing protein [Actinophytocola sp.]|uniref:fibronectin type III domain-containing protein n=1 Tax=Actinophytocola sp. TaxID=1872138 RepID=UPI002E08E1DF|nr:fibronectin type III domain-containing protein [Actinophytocola sp.]
MSSPKILTVLKAGVCLGAVVSGILAGMVPAAAAGDTSAPSVPQNLRSPTTFRGNAVLVWDASTDDSGSVYHYWVIVDGQQRARPAATTYNIQTLVDLCRIEPGLHKITVQAVDRALNRSAPSAPIEINVVG